MKKNAKDKTAAKIGNSLYYLSKFTGSFIGHPMKREVIEDKRTFILRRQTSGSLQPIGKIVFMGKMKDNLELSTHLFPHFYTDHYFAMDQETLVELSAYLEFLNDLSHKVDIEKLKTD